MEVDRLEVLVEAEASRANKQLDGLITKLNSVSNALNGVNTGGLQSMATGITRLSSAMQSMSGIKTTDFTRLAKNIQKLGTIDSNALYKTSNSLRSLINTMNGVGSLSNSAIQLGEFTKNIAKLGSVSIERAAKNLPLLSTALRDFMRTVSSAPNVSENVVNMTNAMANLASQGAKYGSSINGMARAAKTLNSPINKATNSIHKFNASQKRSVGLAGSLSTSLSKLALAFFTIKRAVGFIGASIEKSMDFTETVNLFQTSFKKIGMETAAKQGMKWGSDAAEKFSVGFIDKAQQFNDKIVGALSLDPDSMMNYQAIFAQMSNSMGLVSDTAMNISESFTMLGNDIASLFNIDTEKAMQKLQAGLAGQTKPLRELGIDITQANLQLTAYRYGITDSVAKMSQAAKVQLRWLSIMDQSEVAFGDMAKTINSPANQLRVLRQQWNNLSRSIGNVFMPIVAKVLPIINAVVIALRRMIDALAKLVGFEVPDYKDTDIYTEAPGIGDLIDDYDDVAKGADKATKANEKLKKSLMGFDQVNILTDNSDKDKNKGTNPGGGGSSYPELDDAISAKTQSYLKMFQDELDKMNNKTEKMADNIVKFFQDVGNVAEPTIQAVKRLWDEGLSKVVNFTWTALKDFYKDFLVPIGKWVLGEQGIPKLINALTDLLKDINWSKLNGALSSFLKAVQPLAQAVGQGFINFVSNLAKELKPVIVELIDKLADGLKILADVLKKVDPSGFEKLGEVLGAFVVSTAVLKGLEKLGIALGGVVGPLKSLALMDPVSFSIFFGDLFASFDEGLRKFGDEKFGKFWTDFFSMLSTTGMFALGGLALGGLPGAVIGAIVGVFVGSITIDSFKEYWKKVWDTLFNFDSTKEKFQSAINHFKEAFKGDKSPLEIGENIVLGIIKGFQGAITFFIEPIADLFNAVWKGIKKIFGIQSPAKEMKPLGDFILKGLIEGFIGGIGGWWTAIEDWFVKTKNKFTEKAHGIVKSISDGVAEKKGDLKGSMSTLAKNTVEFFGDTKTKFLDKGKDIINGIQDGWNNAKGEFTSWLGKKPEEIRTGFGNIKTGFFEKGKDIINGIKNGWDSIWPEFKSWLNIKPDAISTGFGTLKNGFNSKGKDIISGLKQGWNDNWGDFKTWLSSLPKKIASGIGSLKQAGIDLIKGFITGLKSIKIPKLDISLDSTTKSFFGNEIKVPKLNVKWYATGGQPNFGEMFVARESGPEMVGRIGNRTTVANNDQIVDAVSIGVANAVAEVLGGMQGGGKETVIENIINLNDDVLFKSVQRAQRENDFRYHTTAYVD